MLALGLWRPRAETWIYHHQKTLDLNPWNYAVPCATTLLSCVLSLYLLFSPLGLVGGLSHYFVPCLIAVIILNIGVWWYFRALGWRKDHWRLNK